MHGEWSWISYGYYGYYKPYGQEPANFLDVGGATKEKVSAAFKLILSDKMLGILINIFGGIMRCDVLAHVVDAAKEQSFCSLVVRLAGTNFKEGKEILKIHSKNFISD